jgi:3-hydroxyisobutyrate dehydrogenase-like beta-hydroxyacid dehydrogenase
VLDVTISGSTPAAEQGELTLFGGGDQDRFATAEAIFRVIVRKYFYVGPSGSGATMKLVVNALLGIGMQAIAVSAKAYEQGFRADFRTCGFGWGANACDRGCL